jgi:hypothetical protein
MFILPKVIYRFNVIPIKTQAADFTKLGKTIPKLIQIHKRTQNNHCSLEQKNKNICVTTPALKIYYKVIVTKQYRIGIQRKHRLMGQNTDGRNKSMDL